MGGRLGSRARVALAAMCCALLLACAADDRAPAAPSGGATSTGKSTSVPGTSGSSVDTSVDETDASVGSAGSAAPEDGGKSTSDPVASTPAQASIHWDDPEGDVSDIDGLLRYPLDIVDVRAESDGDELLVSITFDRTLAAHFAFAGINGERTGGAPAEVYLDLDDDPSTGESPTWYQESVWADELMGYEAELHVILGYDYTSKADGTPGSAGGDAIIDSSLYENLMGYADYWLWETAMGTLPDGHVSDTREYTHVDGATITLHIPYAWLDVKPGDRLRVMYREQDQGPASGLGYSQNKRILLR